MRESIANGTAIDEILKSVLSESPDAVIVRGIVNNYGINVAKLQERRDEVVAMLDEMSDEFMDTGGGGWSFLNLCTDKHGVLWTGMHQTCERLMVLGTALELATFDMFPRNVWSALPGNVPYIMIYRSKFAQ